MTNINLLKIFDTLKYEPYVIVKIAPNFPEYSKGSDVDIFAYDGDRISKLILPCLVNMIDDNLSLNILRKNNGKHLYLDVIRSEVILFRFDIYSQLPLYKNILIKPSFFESVVENYQYRQFVASDGATISVKVPSDIDDNILRYIEYSEWFMHRPDKVKHLDFIVNNLHEDMRNEFFTKLHHYIEIPPDVVTSNSEDVREIAVFDIRDNKQDGYFKRFVKWLRNKSLKRFIKKIVKRHDSC